MKENLKLMRCGNCGNSNVKIYSEKDDLVDELFAECVECKSVTVICVIRPKLSIEWDETDSNGILCIF